MNSDQFSTSSTELIHAFYHPPSWVTGHISPEDAKFLHRTVCEFRPEAIIEVGVASGCSSAAILHALDQIGCGKLESYDITDRCYFDETRAVGSAVAEMGTPGQNRWCLHLGKALDAGRDFAGRRIPMAFIDATHAHPWPTLDAIALLPAMAPDGWLVLHDINLPHIYKLGRFCQFGAQFLYDGWPGEKRRSGGCQDNIGAVRLLNDTAQSRRALMELLSIPWETKVHESVCPAVLGVATWPRRDAVIVDRVREISQAGRAVALWGAGSAGRRYLSRLRREVVGVSAVIDSNPELHDRDLEGVKVVSPRWLEASTCSGTRPFVVITSMYFREIAASLVGLGFAIESDFAVADVS